jgi:hypothetical protein
VTIPPDHAALPRRPRRHQPEAYPELDPVFYDDVAKAYGEELQSLFDAGCRYVQMDDTNMAYLCDEKMREAARQRGDDPNELPHRYASSSTRWWRTSRPGMTLAMHLCRGNFKSTHAAAGNYEPVAEALLSEMNLDAFFLEYDDDRSGDFRPLRYLSKGKIVVLGLVTTKFGQMESKDALKRRIDEASKYAPLDQLCLSPQCGFSSTVHGNNIAVEDAAQQAAPGRRDRAGSLGVTPPARWRRRQQWRGRCRACGRRRGGPAASWRSPASPPAPRAARRRRWHAPVPARRAAPSRRGGG